MSESLVGIHACDSFDCIEVDIMHNIRNTPLHNELQEQQYAYIHIELIELRICNYTLKMCCMYMRAQNKLSSF